jgi:hypothetical protein
MGPNSYEHKRSGTINHATTLRDKPGSTLRTRAIFAGRSPMGRKTCTSPPAAGSRKDNLFKLTGRTLSQRANEVKMNLTQ